MIDIYELQIIKNVIFFTGHGPTQSNGHRWRCRWRW